MNGSNAPFGLKPTRMIDGSPWNGGTSRYLIASAYATSLYVGDPVTLLSDGTIGIGVAGSPIIGVFLGVKYQTSAGAVFPGGLGGFGAAYWPASTALATGTVAEAAVCDNPNVLFEIQSNTSAGVTTTGLNLNYNFVSAAGSNVTGISAYALNVSSGSSTVDNLNLKALRFPQYPGNLSGVGYNVVECVINNHQLKGGRGTTGA